MQNEKRKMIQKRFQQLILVFLIMFLFIGCSATDSTTTPIQPTATIILVPQIEVIFDGNECTLSGQTELPLGYHSIVFYDQSELDLNLHVNRITDGKTYQDLIDVQWEPDGYWKKPAWVITEIQPRSAVNRPDGGVVHTYKFEKEGERSIYISKHSPFTLVFCAPFQVIDDSSE
jgi:hypothetical protein